MEYEIIVVDNASHDGSFEMCKNEYPSVQFIQSKENIGFGRANNLGATYAQGAVFLFLNPDTEIQNGAINYLYSQFPTLPVPGVLGCRLISANGSLQTSCVQSLPTVLNQVLDAEVLRRLFPRSRLWGIDAFYNGNAVTEVEALSGACMMIRREVFNSIGGFSSEYFMYGEDLDLCLKAQRAGLKNYHIREAVVVHHGGVSSKQTYSEFSVVMMRESVSRLLRKSNGRLYSECYKSALSIAAVARIAVLIILFPAWAVSGRTSEWSGSFRKWSAILRWGIGLFHWPPQYRLPELPVEPNRSEMT